jgi:hypothetical protein
MNNKSKEYILARASFSGIKKSVKVRILYLQMALETD